MVKLVDRPHLLKLEDSFSTSEQLTFEACKRGLALLPSSLNLFGLKVPKGPWLAPCQKPPLLGPPLELRLRFKTPHPDKLREADKNAFNYYYFQIRLDFESGIVLKKVKCKSNNEESRKKKVTLLARTVKLASLNMSVDILEQNMELAKVLKNFDKYLPKDNLWDSPGEKLIGLGKLKKTAQGVVNKWLNNNFTAAQLKLEFLNNTEDFFGHHFQERYPALLLNQNPKVKSIQVALTVIPPFKQTVPPFDEQEPYICLETENVCDEEEKYVCSIEELCNISLKGSCIEIARKNGTMKYFSLEAKDQMYSLLSLLSGYYRLCEKWTFTLCPDLYHPQLDLLTRWHCHGPIDSSFAEAKFTSAPGRNAQGTYLLRQSTQKHAEYYLHHIGVTGGQPLVLQITEIEGQKFQVHGEIYGDFLSMIKDLKQKLDLKTCLHPSEFDRPPNILLCRSIASLEADLVCKRPSQTHPPVFIPFSSLSRYENKKFRGHLTNVWKGRWHQSPGKKVTVAIKQLKHDKDLLPFMQMAYNAMLWDEVTLVKVYGASLATPGNPMALVSEYFVLGPADLYVRDHKEELEPVDLLEAAACLARALWYLEEQDIVHGNIRLANVFVATHEPGESFKVKLGDNGLPDYTSPEQVHWLSFELLLDTCPTASKCSTKGDVWALATTLWQLFSYGEMPLTNIDPMLAKQQYLRGDRLAKPLSLRGCMTSVYEVMLGCWIPVPGERKQPQVIMRDINQLLYRVFNSRKVHTYLSIDEDNLKRTDSVGTLQTDVTDNNSGSTTSEATVLHNEPPKLPEKNKVQLVDDEEDDDLQEFGTMPTTCNTLVPTFNDMMARFRQQAHIDESVAFLSSMTGGLVNGNNGTYGGSQQALLSSDSRSGSSMDGSLMHSYLSQMTMQTSLSSFGGLYSMSSIYQLSHKEQLELKKDFPLGEGHFGVVYSGVLSRSNGDWDQVAVKMLKDRRNALTYQSSEAAHAMQQELEIMRGLCHENVVRIRAIIGDEGIIIMEFVKGGALDRYLHVNRDTIRFPEQLFTYAHNIVDGMDYLARRGIIHRDLAARNILVASEELVKISDFGLARLIQPDQDYYVMSTKTNIPVKWLAIECLEHNVYSTASDVWSFGVVLWEMFSFGESPYLVGCEDYFKPGSSDQKIGADMTNWLQHLNEGLRFPRTEKCPVSLYSELMLPCWDGDAKNRPNFAELRHMVGRIELRVT